MGSPAPDLFPRAIIGFDPGRDKCGVAVMVPGENPVFCQVVPTAEVFGYLETLIHRWSPVCLVLGNQTTAKQWLQQLQSRLSLAIHLVDERHSTVEARDRYWDLYPPRGWQRLIPRGMRTPPRPVDDIVALILIERYAQSLTPAAPPPKV